VIFPNYFFASKMLAFEHFILAIILAMTSFSLTYWQNFSSNPIKETREKKKKKEKRKKALFLNFEQHK
jgi:hypothetical protein